MPPSAPDVARELGEGIGLSIVKRLCELLSVAIELVTEPGRGTLFRLSFPLTLSAPPSADPLQDHGTTSN
jgi:signal transduction histidine kinase